MRAVLVFAMLSLLSACAKPADVPAPAPAAPVVAQGAAPAPIAPRIEGPVGDALDAYEKMRAAFAADDGATALQFAQPLADAAQKASEGAPEPMKATWTALAAGSQKLATEKPALKPARLMFADVSKQLVTLLVADPTLREGRFLFECPMAPAYQRWVQTTPALRNPYWGSEMLECGSALPEWKV